MSAYDPKRTFRQYGKAFSSKKASNKPLDPKNSAQLSIAIIRQVRKSAVTTCDVAENYLSTTDGLWLKVVYYDAEQKQGCLAQRKTLPAKETPPGEKEPRPSFLRSSDLAYAVTHKPPGLPLEESYHSRRNASVHFAARPELHAPRHFHRLSGDV